ncbi:probable transmembrane GTPase FZO-like, chloroplastic [Asparagus officinalis]|uniref:probable transmembrane GTPase FZO-like, chloroplastic n=1 Tax=Asparagus officinalis TaxID=4686 RepID=UPI00098E3F7F|nr:probable transmembrane GTPase FZO-like, chloroplastic [Asparagus officinalis]
MPYVRPCDSYSKLSETCTAEALSDHAGVPSYEDLAAAAEIHKKTHYCTIKIKITTILNRLEPWFYACKGYNKKVDKDVSKDSLNDKSRRIIDELVPRYIVKILVKNSTDNARVILFDAIETLIGCATEKFIIGKEVYFLVFSVIAGRTGLRPLTNPRSEAADSLSPHLSVSSPFLVDDLCSSLPAPTPSSHSDDALPTRDDDLCSSLSDALLSVTTPSSPIVAFLLYVQQWKKRIVFVLNKLDIYRNTSELEEATAFIKENTCNLLSVEDIRLYPVSAHSALEAKISASNYSKRSYDQLLSNDPRWATSRFYELEKFLFSFLDGSTEYGMERMRLKLETPIGIADRLLSFCVRLVKQDYENASQDLISIKEMVKSVDVCTMKMEQESRSWRKRVVSLIETARTRAIELVESTLQLSNVDIIATYTFKREGSAPLPVTSAVQNEIINPAITDAQLAYFGILFLIQTNITRGIRNLHWNQMKGMTQHLNHNVH